SKITSIDSFFASPMKPHVLTTMTSARSGSSTRRHWPILATPSMTSVSTRFLGQPRLTKWMVFSASGIVLPISDEASLVARRSVTRDVIVVGVGRPLHRDAPVAGRGLPYMKRPAPARPVAALAPGAVDRKAHRTSHVKYPISVGDLVDDRRVDAEA